MLQVEDHEEMHRSYFCDGLGIGAIAKEYPCSRRVVRKALLEVEPRPYTVKSASRLAGHGDCSIR